MWLDMGWKEKTSIAQDAINVCEKSKPLLTLINGLLILLSI